ncbi:hypothetical protein M2352_002014 [Azospirillum fermentarium]|uniref:hypothetical protein n=1 Tax=Azospirillum fermentarium TaxID=1233114 RepID=UPI002227C58B|nr:hypothetical protein [Azospirillum fermentarium]MCW2246423.1 hypothetical protein [Azospirillum fermentarium]
MSGIFSILSDGQAGLFRLQQARRAAAGGATGPAATGNAVTDTAGGNAGASGASAKNGGVSATKDGTSHLSELLAKGASDSLTDFMRGAATALNAMKQAQQVSQPKARAEEKLQDAERRIKELRNEMRMAAARGDRAKVMQLAKEAAALAKQAGNAAKEYGRGIAASADMAAGGGVSIQTTTASTTTSTMTAEVSQTTATVSVTAGAETDGTAAATAASTAAGAVTAEAPPPVPVEAPPPGTGTGTAQTSAQPARQGEDKGGGDLAAAINAAVAAVGGGGSAAEGKEGASATDQGAAPANPFQAQMDANAQRTARFREADTFARRVEMVLAAVKNVLGEAKASNAYDTDHTRRKNNREELKQYDKVVEEADKAVLELRASAFGTPGGGASATATAGVTADAGGAVNAAVPVPAGSSVNVVT